MTRKRRTFLYLFFILACMAIIHFISQRNESRDATSTNGHMDNIKREVADSSDHITHKSGHVNLNSVSRDVKVEADVKKPNIEKVGDTKIRNNDPDRDPEQDYEDNYILARMQFEMFKKKYKDVFGKDVGKDKDADDDNDDVDDFNYEYLIGALHERADTGEDKPLLAESIKKRLQFNQVSYSAHDRNCTGIFTGDSLVRNCVTSDVIGRIPGTIKMGVFSLRTKESVRKSPEDGKDRSSSFQNVFVNRQWGHSWDGNTTGLDVSGRGATLSWTQEAIAGLNSVITQIKQMTGKTRIKMLDIPCGDMKWMSRFLSTRDDVDYTGADIVPDIIEHHRTQYSASGWRFISIDIVEDELTDTYDLIFCRTLLQHLYTSDILKVLNKFSKSGSGHLYTTTFSKQPFNTELELRDNPGRVRDINLEVPPLSLSPPLCLHRDGPAADFEGWKHYLGLWKLPLKQVMNCKKIREFKLMGTEQTIYSCVEWSPYIDLTD